MLKASAYADSHRFSSYSQHSFDYSQLLGALYPPLSICYRRYTPFLAFFASLEATAIQRTSWRLYKLQQHTTLRPFVQRASTPNNYSFLPPAQPLSSVALPWILVCRVIPPSHAKRHPPGLAPEIARKQSEEKLSNGPRFRIFF